LLDGLEVSIVNLKYILNNTDVFRIDSNYFLKEFLNDEQKIRSKNHNKLKSLTVSIKSFGAYSLNNEVEYLENGIPFIRGVDMKNGNVNFDNVIYISEKAHKLLWKSEITPEMVLLSMSGTIGDIAVASTNWKYPINSSQDLAKIDTGWIINPYFLYAFMYSKFGQNYFKREARGSVQQHVFLSQIEKLEIPILEKDFVTKIEALVKNSHTKLEQSKSLYHEAETLLLREVGLDNWQPPQETAAVKSFSDSFGKSGRLDAEYYQPQVINLLEILHKQKHIKLYQSCNIVNGYAWKSEYFLESENEGFEEGEPFVRIRNCKPGALDIEGLSRLKKDYVIKQNNVEKARSGDIVIGMDGLKWFYASLIVSPCYVNQRVCWLRLNDNYLITPEYLTLFINTIAGQNQLLREMTIADTVGHITNQSVGNIIVPLLSNEKIKKITMMLKNSVTTKFESQRLLELAKKAVETAIEQGEEKAIKEILCPEKICIMKL